MARPALSSLRILPILALLAAGPVGGEPAAPDPASALPGKKVMVLEGGTISGDHLASRSAAYAALQEMASRVGFSLTKGNTKKLGDAELRDVDILVFNYFFETELDSAFPDSSKAAFRRWLAAGHKGYVGYHTSGANEYDKNEWVWYQDNVTSMRYILHGSGTPTGRVERTRDAAVLTQPVMQGLPDTFSAADEWYPYDATSKVLDPAGGCRVMYYLANAQSLDRQPLGVHPVAWFREDSVHTRYFFSTFVHFPSGVQSDWFRSILLRALEYTAGEAAPSVLRSDGRPMPASERAPFLLAGGRLTVDLPGAYSLSILSPLGKPLYRVRAEGRRTFAPRPLSRPGLYLIRVDAPASRYVRRVLVP